MTIRRVRIAYGITKATNTHSEYVILIAFELQQRSHERASMLRLYVQSVLFLSSLGTADETVDGITTLSSIVVD
jgi:hypothetical protein